MLKKLFHTLRALMTRRKHHNTPEVFSAASYGLDNARISRNAVQVVERLHQAGYQAYLVGGCVRDLLLGLKPKDFDVATNATPEQVRQTFRNARIIGRRFKLAHIYFGRELIEVATFRANHSEEEQQRGTSLSDSSGRILRDNVYGSQEEDAQRRDFTINALYYDVPSRRILDYAQGVRDIRNRLIRLIGSPIQRYQEDPVRMLRAVRFAAKLDFQIDRHTAQPITELAHTLENIPASRLFDETLKLFLAGQALRTLELLQDYGLFQRLFPDTAKVLEKDPGYYSQLLRQAMLNTDERIHQDKPVTPAFLYAALLWPALHQQLHKKTDSGLPPLALLQDISQDILNRQCQRISIPKRFSYATREIWEMQERLPKRQGNRADTLLQNPRFRAGYDFLLLREGAGEQTDSLGQWWTTYQTENESGRRNMIQQLGSKSRPPRKRRRKTARVPSPENTQH